MSDYALWARRAVEVRDRVTAEQESEFAAFLLSRLIHAATTYWRYTSDVTDFCVQHIGTETVVFGGTNRLVWSPFAGFVPDRAYCTEKFLAHYATIGPNPGASP